MRVVCDNCGAVYKIADNKLVKDVNKATCKRCGHKIVIFKPGSTTGAEDADDEKPQGDEERTVIKNVPELDKIGQSQGVPSIGSLTAELRAISIPGITLVSGPTPQVLGPGALGPDTKPPPSGPAAEAAAPLLAGPAPVLPALGIPPSDSPKTKAYRGAPQSAAAAAAAAGPGLGGATAPGPIPKPVPPPPPFGLPPAPPSPGGDEVTRPAAGGYGGGRANGQSGPALPGVLTPGAPPPMGTGGALGAVPRPGAVPPPPPPPAGPSPLLGATTTGAVPVTSGAVTQGAFTSTAQVTALAFDGSPVLGTVAGLGAVGLIGLVLTLFWPAPLSAVFYGLAGLGAAGCLFVAVLTQRGRAPERTPLALLLAAVLGLGVGAVAFSRVGVPADEGEQVAAVQPPPAPEPTPAPPPVEAAPVATAGPDGASAPGADGSGLAQEEVDALRRVAEGSAAPPPAQAGAQPARPAGASTSAAASRPPASGTAAPSGSASSSTAPNGPTREALSPSRPNPAAAAEESSGGEDAGPSPFVIDTIIRNNAAIVRCLRVEQARGQDVSGKIYLKFSIAPEGTVSRARVTTSRFAGTPLDTCISNELNALKFPPFEGKAKQITYPLIVQ